MSSARTIAVTMRKPQSLTTAIIALAMLLGNIITLLG